MKTLAEVVIYSLTYLASIAPEGTKGDDEDDDVRALESIVVMLHQCSRTERAALRGAVERIRAMSMDSPEFLGILELIERDIVNADTN